MKTTHRTFTIRQLVDGFVYNEYEGRGLFGLNGSLVIQPEYQRNYIYGDGKKDTAVIESIIRGMSIGMFHFNKIDDFKYELLDGQQRLTSIGRFFENRFPIAVDGVEQYFDGLDGFMKKDFLDTEIPCAICSGSDIELTKQFETVNIVGVRMEAQEIRNAVYHGSFVNEMKKVFSNSTNPMISKWSVYLSGDVRRQAYMETALRWISEDHGKTVEEYMSLHRSDIDINHVKSYFNSVIDWSSSLFMMTEPDMKKVDWGRLYRLYHQNSYDSNKITKRAHELYADESVRNKKGIYEFILEGEKNASLLDIRVFDDYIKKTTYAKQTDEAKKKGISNCPYCAIGSNANANRIYLLKEMDADHVTAWSKGGNTSADNCQMLCISHNRAKGNK